MGTHHGDDGGELPPEHDRPDGGERPDESRPDDSQPDAQRPDDSRPDAHGPDDSAAESGRSPEQSADDPPEWPEVQVPDDLSALDEEAARVRAELAEEQRRAHREQHRERRRQEREQWHAPTGDDGDPGSALPRPGGFAAPTVALSLLVVSVAVLITLVTLFAMTWGPPRIGDSGELPSVTLSDPVGRQVALTTELPAVFVLTDGCSSCDQLVAATVHSAPPGVRVAVVDTAPPPAPTNLAPDDAPPLRLGDPDGVLRSELDLGEPGGDAATVVLVDADGHIVQTVPSATSAAQYQAELTDLGRGAG